MKVPNESNMEPSIKLGKKLITKDSPSYIIAEIGSNHNRDFKKALALIDAAKSAGADAVKFQTFRAETLYSRYAPSFTHQEEKPFDIIKKNEVPWEWHSSLKDYCEGKDIDFCSTAFDLDAVELLEKIGVPFYKIASSEKDNIFLLEKMAKTEKPIILSTGKADLEEVGRTLNYLSKHNSGPVALLHCVSQYPARYKDVNLRALITMKRSFNTVVGFSDHTLDNVSALGAVSLGAKIIEKHITLDKKLPGPDHFFALEPEEFSHFVSSIRNLEQALGYSLKKVQGSELEDRLKGNCSIHAAKDIPKGTKITKGMICIKRPALGISPWEIDDVIGRKAAVNIEADCWITKDLIN